ncbi:MAG: DUF2442 domain-containing protein [Caldilineaceae bacterium]|nr:DUF2442 domain-containing protein [Caldilineaceae bacterium]
MNISPKLYLDSEPTKVTVQDEQLIITLADDNQIELPLPLVNQLAAQHSLPETAELLILREPPQIDHLHVTDSALNVYLTDGRLLSCPLAWFPRLMHGTAAERNTYELSGDNTVIHWPMLDEDIELSRLFQGGKSVESERSLQRWMQSRQVSDEPEMAVVGIM